MDALACALTAAFLTAALSGIADPGGGTILIGVLYAVGMAPGEAVLIAAYGRPFTSEISNQTGPPKVIASGARAAKACRS